MKSCYACNEFHVTIMSSAGLLRRLAAEVCFIIEELKRAWPELKRDPIGFGRRLVIESAIYFKRLLLAPNALAGTLTAMSIVLSVVLSVIMLGRLPTKGSELAIQESEQSAAQIVMLTVPDQRSDEPGVGIQSIGRVGLVSGKGEGSRAAPRRSHGGGSGGMKDLLPAQKGRVPQPSDIRAPIPKFPPIEKQALPVAGIDIDPALWKSLPLPVYGDPRSESTASSNGPGNGGGMGTGSGPGIGEGNGPGFGPGEKGNIGGGPKDRGGKGPGGANDNHPRDTHGVFPVKEVTERARVISKPEPQYTEEARRNQITGTVVLRVVFSGAGEVTSIRAIQSLPFGLTEKAILAARQIRFVPATRYGQPVSVYMQLEYNFNLY